MVREAGAPRAPGDWCRQVAKLEEGWGRVRWRSHTRAGCSGTRRLLWPSHHPQPATAPHAQQQVACLTLCQHLPRLPLIRAGAVTWVPRGSTVMQGSALSRLLAFAPSPPQHPTANAGTWAPRCPSAMPSTFHTRWWRSSCSQRRLPGCRACCTRVRRAVQRSLQSITSLHAKAEAWAVEFLPAEC